MRTYIVQSHVNTKRKIDALQRGFGAKRVETRLKTFLRRVQTRFDIKRVGTRLEKNFETHLDAIPVYNTFKRNLKKILTTSQRVSY